MVFRVFIFLYVSKHVTSPVTLLAEAFPLCFSALYCHSLRGFGCSRFVLVVSVPRKRHRRQPFGIPVEHAF